MRYQALLGTGAMMLCGFQALGAEAPPPGYIYADRSGANLTAQNTVITPDGGWLEVSTDVDAKFNTRIFGVLHNSMSIDAYYKDPFNGTLPIVHLVQFDIWQNDWATGIVNHFAGYSNWTVETGDNGHTYYDWFQEVNGEAHSASAETDENGTYVTWQLANAKPQNSCKTISDWGVYQCSASSHGGPQEIPLAIKSLIANAGWFSDAYHSVGSELQTAGIWLGTKLMDPKVQFWMIAIGTAVATGLCCAGTVAVGCAACIVSIVGPAIVGIAQLPGDDIIMIRSGSLRASGGIDCQDPACTFRTNDCYYACLLVANLSGITPTLAELTTCADDLCAGN
jgi:hypothetical protein